MNSVSRLILSKLTIANLLKWLLILFLTVFFLIAGSFLTVRYWVIPNLDRYRGHIEALIVRSVGVKVTFDRLDAEWSTINPALKLTGVTVFTPEGKPGITLGKVNMAISWDSLLRGRLIFAQLLVHSPTIPVVRASPTLFYIGGFAVDTNQSNPSTRLWFFVQKEIVVQNATVQWVDQLEKLPNLNISGIDVLFKNTWRIHRFAISQKTPTAYFTALDLKGDFKGRAAEDPSAWRGRIYGSVSALDLAEIQRWIQFPVNVTQGKVSGQFWVSLKEGKPVAVDTTVSAENIQFPGTQNTSPLHIVRASTQVGWKLTADYQKINIPKLALETQDGLILAPDYLNIAIRDPIKGQSGWAGQLVTEGLNLTTLTRLAQAIPLSEDIRGMVTSVQPRGVLESADIKWKLPEKQQNGLQGDVVFSARAQVRGLSIRAYQQIPGFENLTATIRGTNGRGSIQASMNNGSLSFPQIFPKPTIGLNRLSLDAGWVQANGRTQINIASVSFQNADLTGRASGLYRSPSNRPGDKGFIDMKASIGSVAATAVPKYLPFALGNNLLKWLNQSLKGGTARNVELTLNGPLSQFPFPEGRGGTFEVRFDLDNLHLRYLPDWPGVEKANGSARFFGSSMTIDVKQAALQKQVAVSAKVEIKSFNNPVLTVNGSAKGKAYDFIQFVRYSPLYESNRHLIESTELIGLAALDLKLSVPLSGKAAPKILGDLSLTQAELLLSETPPIRAASGKVQFSEAGINTLELKGQTLGGSITASGKREKDALRIRLSGQANVLSLAYWLKIDTGAALSGETSWRGWLSIRDHWINMGISSGLEGIKVNLPAPLAKTAEEEIPLRINRIMMLSETREPIEYRWRLSLGKQTQAEWYQSNESGNIVRGKVYFGLDIEDLMNRSPFPEKGIRIGGRIENLNIDEWLLLWPLISNAFPKTKGESMPLAVNVGIKKLTVVQRSFHNLIARTRFNEGQISLNLQSEALSGDLFWDPEGKGKFIGRFDRIYVPKADGKVNYQALSSSKPVSSLPTLDFLVKDFHFEGEVFGTVRVLASNDKDVWKVQKLTVTNEGGVLNLTGQWIANETSGKTSVTLDADVKSISTLFPILGLQNKVTGGRGEIKAQLYWQGLPFNPDLKTIYGQVSFDLTRGEIIQARPGFFGKLLGLISLQSIGRRLSLNFRDVTNDGFVFDSLQGSLNAEAGVFQIVDSVSMIGPSARVRLTGSADLGNDLVNMRVYITPMLSESVAIVSGVIGTPILGGITFLAQKILQDPFERMMRFEYEIGGRLSDPVFVEKEEKKDNMQEGDKE